MDEMDEQEAIRQLKAGNVAGLQVLMAQYQVQAVQTAVLITQDRAVAEDIVQNAFLRSFDRADQFDPARPFRPWFLRMVVNDAIKSANRQKRTPSLDAEQAYATLIEKLEATTEKPEDAVQRREIRNAIQNALQQLSPQQRAVIVQRYYLGLSEQKMSSTLNIAPGTVKWHLNQARERLRILLVTFVK